MFGTSTFYLRRGWSGGHSQYTARISSILSLFGGIAGYPPLLIKGSKIVKIGPFCMETVALPAEKRNAGGFGGGGGGGVGGYFGVFSGVSSES